MHLPPGASRVRMREQCRVAHPDRKPIRASSAEVEANNRPLGGPARCREGGGVTAARPLRQSESSPGIGSSGAKAASTSCPGSMDDDGADRCRRLGLGFARTSLDRSAFELDRLDKAIAEQEAINEQLGSRSPAWRTRAHRRWPRSSA